MGRWRVWRRASTLLARQEAEAEEATLRLLQAAERGQLAGMVGRLSQQLRVPAAYETAILAALGEFGDGLALQTAEDVSAALDHLDGEQPQAQAALLPVAVLRGIPERLRLEGCLGNAAELTGAEPSIRPVVDLLLGRTLIVQDRAAARRLLGSLPEDARLVTLSGEVFHPAGHVLVGGRHRRSIDRAKARTRAETHLATVRTELARVEVEEARARAEVERRKAMSAQDATGFRCPIRSGESRAKRACRGRGGKPGGGSPTPGVRRPVAPDRG